MDKNVLKLRKEKYFQLSSQLAQLDNSQLQALLSNSDFSSACEQKCTISLGQFQIFVKRIPITNTEYKNLFSTQNLYGLPTYFNYGIGSAGLGAFRELITHFKTTHWVLEEEISSFPLLFHYRILPLSKQSKQVDLEKIKHFVEYWGNCRNIEAYMLDRAEATQQIVLFLEYVPYTLSNWLQENLSEFQNPMDSLCKTITFLREKGIIHFDAHFENVLTDGEQTYLTDFGLVLDQSFALSVEEYAFFKQNTVYDYGEILLNLGHLILSSYNSCPESDRNRLIKKYDIQKELRPSHLRKLLLENIESIQAEGIMFLDETYVASIVKYRRIIDLMHNFLAEMSSNPRKDTVFPQVKLRSLLEEIGLLSEAGLSTQAV